MRILHVLTLVSADGAYGGPVAVARAQCEALAQRGHDVTLVAGWDGVERLDIAGVDVRLHTTHTLVPGAGFSGLTSPGLWADIRRLSGRADVVHVHLARDLVTLPAAWLAAQRSKLCIQTHGMIRRDGRFKARSIDAILTRRVIRSAALQLVLTDTEEEDAPRVARSDVRTVRVHNGVTVSSFRATWDGVGTPEVIYCARLHPRKRPVAFIEMAAKLLARGVDARFTIFGPDEGELGAIHAAIHRLEVQETVSYGGPLKPSAVLPRLAKAQVYVLPSINEPFPMSLLEAMSVGLPSVLTRSTGISNSLENARAAQVTNPDAHSLADGVARILRSSSDWTTWSVRARAEIETNYRADTVAERLEVMYQNAASK